ncbi:MAG: RIP metalloprotease RseP, partial [Planctomycetota bacterium]
MNDFGNGLLVALGIGMLIFVHELGHYLAARWIGARVEVFSLGFGPRLWGFRRGPTDYRLSLIPLGGYVAVAGQDPGDQRHPDEQSLQHKTVGQRFLFFSGGVVMNLLFALVAFPIAFGNGVSFPAPVIGNVAHGGAAWEAGLDAGDRVLAIHGKSMYSFENLVVEIALSGGRPVPMLVERDGGPRAFEVLPRYSKADGLYGIGIDMAISKEPATLLVTDDGPAAFAGLETGDQLLAIDGLEVTTDGPPDQDIQERVLSGQPIELRVRRTTSLRSTELTATITPLPRASERALLGVEPMRRLVGGIRKGFHLVEQLALLRDDVLVAVDGVPYRGQDLTAESASGTLRLSVLRGGRRLELSAPATTEDRKRLPEFVALVPDFDSTVLKPMPKGAAEDAGIVAGDRLVSID